jgi:transposase
VVIAMRRSALLFISEIGGNMTETIAYVGLDAHSTSISVAVAWPGQDKPEYLGKIPTNPAAVGKMVEKIAAKAQLLRFCYEAGPTGFALYRQLRERGHDCIVAAPTLIPRKPGERVKTDRRDAIMLATRLRAGDLTPVSVSDTHHEAMRDLVRIRDAAVRTRRRVRQQICGFLLRHGRRYDTGKLWTRTHRRWLLAQKLEHAAHHIVLGEMMRELELADERVARIELEISQRVSEWSMGPTIAALQALRGIGLVAAAVLAVELGDLRRFKNARSLMAYVGLVPSEASSGSRRRQGSITKTGSTRARTVLIEASWNYRFPARRKVHIERRSVGVPDDVKELGWKAQQCLCRRYRHLVLKLHKPSAVACTAVARELLGFIWAIGQAVPPPALQAA